MSGLAARLLPYALAFTSSLCIMILELVSSRLVAPHVGQSLTVWTSVIGIILAGICLGNVLGGRLADRVEPRRAIGPLFALGSVSDAGLALGQPQVGHILPSPDQMNWELRTVLVVVLDFLLPATVLGMVGPVVAKMAVEQARKAGSAIGDVYFWGAIGSIVGTFICGFVLMYQAPNSTIVAPGRRGARAPGREPDRSARRAGRRHCGCALPRSGLDSPLARRLNLGGVDLGSYRLNYLVLAGNAAALVSGTGRLGRARRRPPGRRSPRGRHRQVVAGEPDARLGPGPAWPTWPCSPSSPAWPSWHSRWSPAAWFSATWARASTAGPASSAFCWPACPLATSWAARSPTSSRMRSRRAGCSWRRRSSHLRSSWPKRMPAWFTAAVLGNEGAGKSFLSQAITHVDARYRPSRHDSHELALPHPVRRHVVFFLPALSLGTVSPVVAKLAVDRLETLQEDRHRDRPGLCLGHGRQLDRHLPDRLFPDRSRSAPRG